MKSSASMIPDYLKYTKTHEWIRISRNNTARVGITEFGQRRFANILFLQLPEMESDLEQFDPFGVIESEEKTVTELSCPLSGRVVAVNEELEEDPNLIQQDPYGDGWMIELEIIHEEETKNLMDSAEYEDYIQKGGKEE